MNKTNLISVNNIHRTYKKAHMETKALQGISLEIAKGDFIMITGRNGSGKSTLLHQLGLLDVPDSGEIYLNGEEVTKMSESKRAQLRLRTLGYIFQEYALMDELTALENVMLPAFPFYKEGVCRKRAEDFLTKVDLADKWNHLPSELSGGEQQKVAIARALVNDPMIIFADEPTANLDSIAAHDVLTVFQKLNKHENHTILMVTHEPEEIKYANRVIHLSDGKVITGDLV
jgi:putative ABC transport system ATP-binding protein